MSNSWRPMHENHAIDQMAIVIMFADRLPQLTFRKLLAAYDEAATGLGIVARSEVQNFELLLAAGVQVATPPISQTGRTYYVPNLERPDTPLESLEVLPHQIIYRTSEYVSWKHTFGRFQPLVRRGLDSASELVPTFTLRLEYLDGFCFEGVPSDANASHLLARSRYVSPHVFETSELWHCHIGELSPQADGRVRVLQINIDANDKPRPNESGQLEARRWINIMSALEDRLHVGGLPAEGLPAQDLFDRLDEMHMQLKDVLKDVLLPEISERIYLMRKQ